MKIVDLKCALIGGHPIIRIATDEGTSGYAQIEHHKAFIKPLVLWHDIIEGLPSPTVKNGMIEVWDRPGMGFELIPERARAYLAGDDAAFLD
jgi:hypothetical protein